MKTYFGVAIAIVVISLMFTPAKYRHLPRISSSAAVIEQSTIDPLTTPQDIAETARRLLPEAQRAVQELTGKALPVSLRVVDEFDIPQLHEAFATRNGFEIVIRSGVATEAEVFDTLVHEITHMHTDMPLEFGPSQDVDAIRLMALCNEAISWRFAAELTAERYGTEPAYRWDFLPASTIPKEVVLRRLFEEPTDVILTARDYDLARLNLTLWKP